MNIVYIEEHIEELDKKLMNIRFWKNWIKNIKMAAQST